MRTRFTDEFSVDHPIIQGGMQWVGTARLVAAVANAGALGFITALTQPTPGDLVEEVRRCRELTEKPFGVNLTIARGFVAALALGADAVNMGTRFMCTVEAPIHENIKRHIVHADERQTQHIFRSFRNTARVARNAISEQQADSIIGDRLAGLRTPAVSD